MTMRSWPKPEWFDALPAIRGEYRRNEPLAPLTTIEVGGPAEVFAVFADWNDLAVFLAGKPDGVALTLIGKGSNLMIKDGGIAGVVAQLGKGLDKVEVEGNCIRAEAGAGCGTVARAAREAGLGGLAFFGGIPGSIGGALRMNAGAYGGETFAALTRLWVMDDKGVTREVEPGFVQPRYRHTELPAGWIYKAAEWRLQTADKEEIRQAMREINRARSTTQPLHMPSSGSWFKNPTVNGEKRNAWRVTDEAGCRGMQVGGAQVSEMHSNFFVNRGGATAADFEELSRQVEAQVKERLGIVLEREVRFTGVA